MDDEWGCLGAGFVCLVLCFITCAVTGTAISTRFQNEAVDTGHAEYIIDEGYQKVWRWLDHESER